MSARLILYPKGAAPSLENPPAITEALQDCGFLGEAFRPSAAGDEDRHYLIGEHFLQLVTFMGCAPAIELFPPADGSVDFCHVGVSPLYTPPRFFFDEVLAAPRCPHCRQVIPDWQNRIAAWQQGDLSEFLCTECAETIAPPDINWRRAGGFAPLCVTVFGIYPREAIPTEPLMKALARTTANDWDYFYAR